MNWIYITLREILGDNTTLISDEDWKFIREKRQVTFRILQGLAEREYERAKKFIEIVLDSKWITEQTYVRLWHQGTPEIQEVLAELLSKADASFPQIIPKCFAPKDESWADLLEPDFGLTSDFRTAGAALREENITNIIPLSLYRKTKRLGAKEPPRILACYITENYCEDVALISREDIQISEREIIIENLPQASTVYLFNYPSFKSPEVDPLKEITNKIIASGYLANDISEAWWKKHVKSQKDSEEMYHKIFYAMGTSKLKIVQVALAKFVWDRIYPQRYKAEGILSQFIDDTEEAIFPCSPEDKILFVIQDTSDKS